MLKCDVEIVRDTDAGRRRSGWRSSRRYSGADESDDERAGRWSPSRRPSASALRFAERERATWDHRKLAAGVY